MRASASNVLEKASGFESKMKVSARGKVQPFWVMQMFAEAAELTRAGHDLIHLSLGQPSDEVPDAVRRHVSECMQKKPLGYTEPSGIYPLRERISQHYRERYNLSISPSRIFIMMGASAAFQMSMLAAFDAGDEVAITLPCYPAYPTMMQTLGLKVQPLRGTAATRFQPTVGMLQPLNNVKGIVIANPSNPSGTILHADELKALCHYADAQGIRVIADEIYHGITFGEAASSVLSHSDTAIVVNSFSKYFLMPGWRLGWAVVPEDLVPSFEALVQHYFISPPAVSQYAALAVFDQCKVLDGVVARYARNRQLLMEELPKAGFDNLAPAEGGFFIYADVSKLTNDSLSFCRAMMKEAGVVAIPGIDFDPDEGHRFVRFSYSGSEAQIREALKRLKQWLSR